MDFGRILKTHYFVFICSDLTRFFKIFYFVLIILGIEEDEDDNDEGFRLKKRIFGKKSKKSLLEIYYFLFCFMYT